MSRSARFFEIIQLLRQANAPVTAWQVAEKLEVSKRTIYRDIASLQASGLPIEGEAGIGYVMRSGFDLPPLMFEHEELEAIVVGLALLGRTGDRGLEIAAERVGAKISDVLPKKSDYNASLHVSSWHHICETIIQPGAFRKFIREEAELEIEYLDRLEKKTVRIIRPLALIYYIDVVIVAAWCELRQDFRHFRIDRLQRCTPTGKNFTKTGNSLRATWEVDNLNS